MSQQKRLSNMQRIANAFHFTKEDLLLNRQRKLSEAQRKRMWRRYWAALAFTIVFFGLGGVFLAFFLWGTAPEGTFTFLPPSTVLGYYPANTPLFLFGQIFAGFWVLLLIFAAAGMIAFAGRIQRGELHVYRGMIGVSMTIDDDTLLLLKGDGRSFEIGKEQYDVLQSLVDQRPFAVYYLLSREGIVALEPLEVK